ncbi:NAD(P)/FAD-dependent oxidoreductase [Pseudomonas sp. XS1P51]
MLNLADAVASGGPLPAKVDVVVIGGGIVGVSAAYYLAKKGHSVALIEKGKIAAEQSSRNWGWCRQGGRALAEVPLARESVRLWQGLEHETGEENGFHQPGVLVATNDLAEVAAWEKWIEDTRAFDMGAYIIGREQVAAMTPNCKQPYLAGLYSKVDGLAEPTKAAPGIARAAQRLGVSLHQDCAARGMETKGGKVSAVITEKGVIETDAVICAGGAWSSMFCAHHQIRLPQAGVFASACRTSVAPRITMDTDAVGSDGFSFRRRTDGGYTLAMRGRGRVEVTPQGLRYAKWFLPLFMQRGKSLTLGLGRSFFEGPESLRRWSDSATSPFERMRILDPAPDMALLELAFKQFQAAYPALEGVKIVQAWGGVIDSTPDAVPVISEVESLPGFLLATGFSGHGFALGPGAGRLVADLACNDTPLVDPRPYRHGRFFDGTQHKAAAWV